MLHHRCILLLLLCVGTDRVASSQSLEARDHFQVKIGCFYDQGDYGTSETTKVFFTPVTLRYLGNRFDVSVTPSFAQMNSITGVRLIDGIPTRTGPRTTLIRDTRSGVGDTVV